MSLRKLAIVGPGRDGFEQEEEAEEDVEAAVVAMEGDCGRQRGSENFR